MAGSIIAQKNEVQNAISYSDARFDLKKAKESIDKAEAHPSTSNFYKTFYYKGVIYLKIHNSKKEEENNLDPDALEKSHAAYLKYLQIDTKKKYLDKTVSALWKIANLYFNRGSDEFNVAIEATKNKDKALAKENYNKAVYSFEKSMEIYAMPEYNKVDEQLIYRTGMAAILGEQYDKALGYFNQCIEMKFGGEDVYMNLANIYEIKGDTVKAIATLESGIEANPENNLGILGNLIDFYVQSGKSTEALNYINLAIKNNPENNILFHIKGGLFDKIGEFDTAVEAYKKAIEIAPDFSDSNYNLAIMYFNKGSDTFNDANSESDTEKYNKMQEEGKGFYTQSLPYFDKCHELDPTDPSILDILKRITYRLGLTDRNKEINELIKNLK